MPNLSILKNDGKKDVDGSSNRRLIALIEDLKKAKNQESIPIESIKINPIFSQIFPIQPSILESISHHMRNNGFDPNHPILIWKKTGEIIDGHTRFQAAKNCTLSAIPTIFVDFPDEKSVEEYIYILQFHRRNLSVANRLQFLLNYQQRNGGQRPKHFRNWIIRIFSVSYGTATKYVALIDHQDTPQFRAVINGQLTLNKAYDSLMQQRPSTSTSTSTKNISISPQRPSLDEFLRALHTLPHRKKHAFISCTQQLIHALASNQLLNKKTANNILQQLPPIN